MHTHAATARVHCAHPSHCVLAAILVTVHRHVPVRPARHKVAHEQHTTGIVALLQHFNPIPRNVADSTRLLIYINLCSSSEQLEKLIDVDGHDSVYYVMMAINA